MKSSPAAPRRPAGTVGYGDVDRNWRSRVPRGADAIVMVEHTQPRARARSKSAAPLRQDNSSPMPAPISPAASAAASRHRRRLARDRHAGGVRDRAGDCRAPAACRHPLHRRRTAAGGAPLRAAIYDTNGAIVTAAVSENGGEAVFLGAIADDEAALETAMRKALEASDMLVLSGGTSKGAGDVSTASSRGSASRASSPMAWHSSRASRLSCGMRRQAHRHPAGISDLGDVHLSRHDRAGAAADGRPATAFGCQGLAKVPVRVASELGRTEFVMVSLVEGADGLIAYPTGKDRGR
jgi:putative molybdopterin biosynthesis protein